MTWLWSVDDMKLRVAFASMKSPSDNLTVVTRKILHTLIPVIEIILSPVDFVVRFIGKGLIAVVLGLFVLLVITAVWFIVWLILMVTSRLWLASAFYRPILIIPGILVAIFADIFIMLVPDPHKEREYTTLIKEWPLSWQLWKPTPEYFESVN